MPDEPNLSHLVPATNENRWSDLLATLIATDPAPMAKLVRADADLEVQREVVVRTQVDGAGRRRPDRLDILLTNGDEQVAAIEAKLLAPFGRDQLRNYKQSFPNARQHRVLHLARFGFAEADSDGWQSLTWEAALKAYERSTNEWVRLTAKVWRGQLDELVPVITGETRWRDVRPHPADFEVDLRARMVWLYERIQEQHHRGLVSDLIPASSGGTWVLRMWRDSPVRKHVVTAEVQEGLPSAAWKRDPDMEFADRLRGPSVLVGLKQEPVKTSAGFDWDYLRRTFAGRVFDPSSLELIDGRAWSNNSAAPRHVTDKRGHQAMVADNKAPRWLGQGYGMSNAKAHGACVFGARFTLGPDLSMDQVLDELSRTCKLLEEMAETPAQE